MAHYQSSFFGNARKVVVHPVGPNLPSSGQSTGCARRLPLKSNVRPPLQGDDLNHFTEQESKERDFVDSLLKLPAADRYDLWKYFEARVERMDERLWSAGVWLLGIVAGTLALPFVAKFIEFRATARLADIASPLLLGLVAVFGLAFCVYAYFALRDIRRHMEINWVRGSYARTLVLESVLWGGRKRNGWRVLLVVGSLAILAFSAMLLFAIFPNAAA